MVDDIGLGECDVMWTDNVVVRSTQYMVPQCVGQEMLVGTPAGTWGTKHAKYNAAPRPLPRATRLARWSPLQLSSLSPYPYPGENRAGGRTRGCPAR